MLGLIRPCRQLSSALSLTSVCKPNFYATVARAKKVERAEGRWTPEEEAKLLLAIKKLGKPGTHGSVLNESALVTKRKKKAEKRVTWQDIADFVGSGRTKLQVALKYCRSLHPDLKKGAFTAEEDEKLRKLVERYGRAWVLISQDFEGRTPRMLEQRYHRKVVKHVPLGLAFREARAKAIKNAASNSNEKWVDLEIVRKVSAAKSLQRLGEDLSAPLVAAVIMYGFQWPHVLRFLEKDYPNMRARASLMLALNQDRDLVKELDQVWKAKLRTRRQYETGLLGKNAIKEGGETQEEFAKEVFNPENAQDHGVVYNFMEPEIKLKITKAFENMLLEKASSFWSVEHDLAMMYLIFDTLKRSGVLDNPKLADAHIMKFYDKYLPRLERVFSHYTAGRIKYRLLRCHCIFGTDTVQRLKTFVEQKLPEYHRVFSIPVDEVGDAATGNTIDNLKPKEVEKHFEKFFYGMWDKKPQPPTSVFSQTHDANIIPLIGTVSGHATELVKLLGTEKIPQLCLTREHLSARYWQLSAACHGLNAVNKILETGKLL